MMMDEQKMSKLVNGYFDAVQGGDVEKMMTYYHDDAVIWRNIENEELNAIENMKFIMRRASDLTTNRRYEDRKLTVFPGGFVLRAVLRATRKYDGAPLEMQSCAFGLVENGKITRLEGYFDSAEANEFRAYPDAGQ